MSAASLAGGIGGGFAAGVLSVLSPCVLPLVPLLAAAALASHRAGLLALGAGLAVSFTAIGLFVATVGFAAGLDQSVFRAASGVLLAVFGLVLLSGAVQARVALAGGGLAGAGQRLLDRLAPRGWPGQLAVGAVLGMAWSPCVGPTLGAASLLAAQGRDLPGVAATMLAFGLGAALPLVLLGSLPRQALLRWRGGLARAGRGGRLALGGAALLVAALLLTGLDRRLEAVLVAGSPPWLTALTTRF